MIRAFLSFALSVLLSFVVASAVAYATGAPVLALFVVLFTVSAFVTLPAGVLASAGPIFATNEQRAVYQNIKTMISDIPNAFATRASLRLEQVGSTRNRYRFPVLADEGTARASERRLARTDAFFVDRIGMFIGERTVANTFGGFEINSWANPLSFPTATSVDGIACMLNTGVLSIEVDNVKYLQLYDAMQSRFVSEAQDGTGPAVIDQANGWDNTKNYGQMVPTIRLNGGSSNVIEWSVNEAVNLTASAGTHEEVLVIILDGWLAANAGEFQPNRRVGNA